MRLHPASLLAFLTLLVTPHLDGNPILMVDRPHRLQSERVTITVGEEDSRVIGDYVFVPLGPAPRRGRPMEMIEVPVILPAAIVGEEAQKRAASASIKITGEENRHILFDWDHFSDESDPVLPGLPELPAGWKFAWLTFPVTFTGPKALRVRISYRQPHLPGGVASYLPILPNPDPAGRYRVTFASARGLRLEPLGDWTGTRKTHSGRTTWIVRPQDHKMLKMRVASENAPASGR